MMAMAERMDRMAFKRLQNLRPAARSFPIILVSGIHSGDFVEKVVGGCFLCQIVVYWIQHLSEAKHYEKIMDCSYADLHTASGFGRLQQ